VGLLVASAILVGCSNDGDTNPSRADEGPCEVALTQGDSTQVLTMSGPKPSLHFASPGTVNVSVTGKCREDLAVQTVTPERGGGLRFGVAASATLTLDAAVTRVALTYQPCRETSDNCWGPEVHRMYKVEFGP
jgi:hypothetical protein